MTDTHCHIYLKDFDEDRSAVLDRAAEAGVKTIFMPAINLATFSDMREMNHPDITFYSMAGIHPVEIRTGMVDTFVNALSEAAEHPDYVAIGETGLDYYWSKDHIPEQKKSLNLHCEIAKTVKKPVILHNRSSTEDMLDIIEHQQDGSLTGIWHCFNGTEDEGKKAIDLNLDLGIGGVITFKNAGVDKTVKNLPLNRLVLETDAPYLAPHPKRGKRNEPAYLAFTARKLAEIKNCDTEEVIRKTTANADRIFGTG